MGCPGVRLELNWRTDAAYEVEEAAGCMWDRADVGREIWCTAKPRDGAREAVTMEQGACTINVLT